MTGEETRQAPEVLTVIDNRSAPTLLVDGIHGLSLVETNVVFNLTRTTIAAPGSGDPQAYIDTVLRVAIPFVAFVRIAEFLKQNSDAIAQNGLITPLTLKKDAV